MPKASLRDFYKKKIDLKRLKARKDNTIFLNLRQEGILKVGATETIPVPKHDL
ncbi:MAG: hypothetical protein AAB531_04865 [Patescibacteria group bacterium]